MTRCGFSYAVAIGCLLALILLPSSHGRVHRRLMGHHNAGSVRHQHGGRHLAQNSSGLCAVEGPAASATFKNASRTCLTLHSSGAPIQAPADTNTTKWGQLFLLQFAPVIANFLDREGNTYFIDASANPPNSSLELQSIWPLLAVKAQLVDGIVVSFTTELYVPYSTIMSTMVGSQFEGLLHNASPRPAGALDLVWFRWTFGYEITITNDVNKYGTLLHGTFDNLFTNILDSQGNCQAALCADPTRQSDACKYYIEYFGNTTNTMTLNWDPNMHMALDTELVPMFDATHRQYMARFINLNELMLPTYHFVPHAYIFINHGTPMGVPQNFTGMLTPATPVVPCNLQ